MHGGAKQLTPFSILTVPTLVGEEGLAEDDSEI